MASRLVKLDSEPREVPDNKALDTGITVLSASLLVVSLLALVQMPLNSALLHIVLVSSRSCCSTASSKCRAGAAPGRQAG